VLSTARDVISLKVLVDVAALLIAAMESIHIL
jgi:hypothetical protein